MSSAPLRAAVVVGAGPAGLMACEALLASGITPVLLEALPSPARKFLRAGVGGLNMTHAEPLDLFLSRYDEASPYLRAAVRDFPPTAVRAWAEQLGIETFVGSSQRVFPVSMKAAPLLRRWLARLRQDGLTLLVRHRLMDWSPTPSGHYVLTIDTPDGVVTWTCARLILALGGASWSRLGATGTWTQTWASARRIACQPWQASNVGYHVAWTPPVQALAGRPLKNVVMTVVGAEAPPRRGEAMLRSWGLEGSLVYALGRVIRAQHTQPVTLSVDVLPDVPADQLVSRWQKLPAKATLSRRLTALGLDPVKKALVLSAIHDAGQPPHPGLLKALPLTLGSPRPLDEAISVAGGVSADALDDTGQLIAYPGVWCAGEMTDWDAPTGGYLLTACWALGRRAGLAAAGWPSSVNCPSAARAL